MADETFEVLAGKLDDIGRDLGASRSQMAKVGVELRPEIDRAVRSTPSKRGSLADGSMSGFRRGGPIEITGTSRVVADHAVLVEPVKRAKGPMAVLERGRNLGGSGGTAGPGVSADGTTRRNKNGQLRKVRAFKTRRWNGYTEPKGTMSVTASAIESKAPGLINTEVVAAILRKRLG